MGISGIGPSIVTAVKIQQLTRARPTAPQVAVAPIRDVLDLSSVRSSRSIGQLRAFSRSAIHMSRSGLYA